MYIRNSISQYRNIFQLVREINIIDIINKFNIMEIRQRGSRWQGICPLPDHSDKHPSFYIYPDGRWKCFGCQAHGDSVDLVSKVYGLKPIEAARMIANDFGIEVDKPLSPEASRKAKQLAKERVMELETVSVFDSLLDNAIREVSLILRTTNHALATGGYEAHIKLANLVHKLPYLEYLLDMLMDRDLEVQAAGLVAWEDEAWLF